MKRPGFWPLAWGLLIGASSGILWGFAYGLPGSGRGSCTSATCVAQPALQAGLLSAAGFASALLGVVLIARRTTGIDRTRRPIADQSMATVIAAAGLGLVGLGGAVGAWLVYIGLGITAAGIGGVIREGLAIRELRRRDPGP